MRPRPTDNFACTRALKKSLIEGSTNPDLLREIIAMADRLVFTPPDQREDAIVVFQSFCEAAPCILWTPEDDRIRHVTVQIYSDRETVISVSRAMWACVHTISQQGEQLRANEQLHHTCEKNGRPHTGWGACLNPSHFIRGDAKTNIKLKLARAALAEVFTRAGVHA